MPGSWRLDEVYDETGINLPDGPYDTIAGLVLTSLERMAAVGDIVRFEGIILRVRELDRLRITQVAIETTRKAENQ